MCRSECMLNKTTFNVRRYRYCVIQRKVTCLDGNVPGLHEGIWCSGCHAEGTCLWKPEQDSRFKMSKGTSDI